MRAIFIHPVSTNYPCIYSVLLGIRIVTGLPVWQSQSESGWDVCLILFLFFLFFFFFFRVGKSLACHSPAKWYLCA